MFHLSSLADPTSAFTLPMLFDGGLTLLLAVTLIYVARLNRRMGVLKRERIEFDAAIERFATAAAETHRAMAALRQIAEGEGRVLQEQVKKGGAIAEDLDFLIGRATSAADRLESVIGQSRHVEPRQAESRRNEVRSAGPRSAAPVGRDTPSAGRDAAPAKDMPRAPGRDSAPSKELPKMLTRDLSKATALMRAIAGDRNLLERDVSRGGPATVTRRPVAAESLPEGERALLKALAGLR
jgi:hypothetical protein